MIDESGSLWGRDMTFEVEALLEMSEGEARRRLDLTMSSFRALCASGRLLPSRMENGRGIFARDDVLRVQRILDRARRLERARRVHDPKLLERGKIWSEHLRHEASRVRGVMVAPQPDTPVVDVETLATALEAAARVLESSLAEA